MNEEIAELEKKLNVYSSHILTDEKRQAESDQALSVPGPASAKGNCLLCISCIINVAHCGWFYPSLMTDGFTVNG